MSEPNFLLDALLDEARISYAGLASRLNMGQLTRYDHTAVARWIRDHAIPRGDAPSLICEIIGPKVGRVLTLADIGMDRRNDQHGDVPLMIAGMFTLNRTATAVLGMPRRQRNSARSVRG